MLVWGSSAYLAWLVPSGLASDVARRLHRYSLVAIGIAVVSSLLALPIQTAEIGDGWNDALDLGTLGDVLFDTTVGRAWQAQAIATLILLSSAKERAVADTARKAAIYTALWAFVALLIGGFSASYMATVGGRVRDDLPAT